MNVPTTRPTASFWGELPTRHSGGSWGFGGRIKYGELAR